MINYLFTGLLYLIFIISIVEIFENILDLNRLRKLGSTSNFLFLFFGALLIKEGVIILQVFGIYFDELNYTMFYRIVLILETYSIILFLTKNFIFSDTPLEQILMIMITIFQIGAIIYTLFDISTYRLLVTQSNAVLTLLCVYANIFSDKVFMLLISIPLISLSILWVFSISKKFNPKKKDFFIKNINFPMLCLLIYMFERMRFNSMFFTMADGVRLLILEVVYCLFSFSLFKYLKTFNKIYYIEHDIPMEAY